jgi:pimeloyl-ACP methyl ester carboxylesterase
MKGKRFNPGRLALLAILAAFLALAACQSEEQFDEVEATLEATVQPVDTEEPTLEATEEPPTPEPTPVPPTPEPTPEPVAAYEPVFEPVDCWWTLPESQPVDCGYLVVPENRGNPDSPEIRVATAILRHPGGNPELDPIINVHGGPGGGSLKVFDLAYSEFTPFFETNRDVIVFDQRGVGLSEPELDCPELKAAMNDLFDHTLDGQQLTDSEVQDHLLEMAVACGDAFSQTIDLSAYDSANSAADINDLRIALGYEQINLYGESYGPRVVQSVMRDFPDILRSVVLDAPMSTNSPFENEAREFGNALNQLFEACAADEACNTAYPDLRTVWFDTLSQLDETPVSFSVTNPLTGEEIDILLDDGALSTALWRFSYSTSNVPAMPALIYAASQGDYAPAKDAISSFLIPLSVISIGDFYNVGCRERDPISSIESFDAILDEYPETRAFWEENFLESRNQLFSPSLCQTWGGGGIANSEYEPVVSSIPTILTVGNHDPSADVEETALIAETLENSFGPYAYDGMAHVVYGKAECPTSMINAFIIDPTTEPDASCLEDMSLTFMIPGEASEIALEPFSNEEMGYTTQIPTGWEEIIPGAYSRGNPAIDPTILAQLSSPNETAEDFLGQILANLGVAALPETPVRVMDSDTLSWSIYLVSGDPTTAVALAEDETTTYMVAMKAAADEFDALADSLFVPAIVAFTPTE